MRQIVYNNIMKLIEKNHSVEQQTKNGTKYVLYGTRQTPILSLYSNNRKIELFMNDELFASAKTPTTLFCEQSTHFHQLSNIKDALSNQPLHYPKNDIHGIKYSFGATPKQTNELQLAWWKSYRVNYEMCNALGNSR